MTIRCLVKGWTSSCSISETLVVLQHTGCMRNKQDKYQALASSQLWLLWYWQGLVEQVPHLACWDGGLQALQEGEEAQGGVALYEKRRLDCTVLTVTNDVGARPWFLCCSVCYQEALRRNLWVDTLSLLEIATSQTHTVNTVLLWQANLGNVWSFPGNNFQSQVFSESIWPPRKRIVSGEVQAWY